MAYDSYTKALLHMNGSDASTTFTDESGKTWTAAGNAQIDTAQSVFGGASGLFDGTGDYISTPDHEDFVAWKTLDFRVRFAALPTTGGGNNGQVIFQQASAATDGWQIKLWVFAGDNTRYRIQAYAEVSGSSTINYDSIWTTPLVNTWYHIAVVQNGSEWATYVDGTSIGTATDADTIPNIAAPVRIGAPAFTLHAATENALNGWVDEVRFSATPRWTANFTPPTQAYSGPILLQANPRTYSLKGMEKGLFDTPVLVTTTDNWVDSAGNQMVDSDGNNLVFNSGSTTYPYVLKARKRNYTLRAPKVKHGE